MPPQCHCCAAARIYDSCVCGWMIDDWSLWSSEIARSHRFVCAIVSAAAEARGMRSRPRRDCNREPVQNYRIYRVNALAHDCVVYVYLCVNYVCHAMGLYGNFPNHIPIHWSWGEFLRLAVIELRTITPHTYISLHTSWPRIIYGVFGCKGFGSWASSTIDELEPHRARTRRMGRRWDAAARDGMGLWANNPNNQLCARNVPLFAERALRVPRFAKISRSRLSILYSASELCK